MLLYHGTNLIISQPKLVKQNRFLDFGFGFYTTTNYEQAQNFSIKVAKRVNFGSPYINIYEVDESKISKLSIKKFHSPNEEWLKFVSQNRKNIYKGPQYDIIIGPVANDDVYRTVGLYLDGVLSLEQMLEILKIKQLYNQYVFSTEKALSSLRFKEAISVFEDKV